MLVDLLCWLLGVALGLSTGPWAWRLGYRVHGVTGDSVVARPWARPTPWSTV